MGWGRRGNENSQLQRKRCHGYCIESPPSAGSISVVLLMATGQTRLAHPNCTSVTRWCIHCCSVCTQALRCLFLYLYYLELFLCNVRHAYCSSGEMHFLSSPIPWLQPLVSLFSSLPFSGMRRLRGQGTFGSRLLNAFVICLFFYSPGPLPATLQLLIPGDVPILLQSVSSHCKQVFLGPNCRFMSMPL